jgi:hypothetical protein
LSLLGNQNLIAGHKNINFSVGYWGFEIGLLAKGKENRIRHCLKEVLKKKLKDISALW